MDLSLAPGPPAWRGGAGSRESMVGFSDAERMQTAVIRELLSSYFGIISTKIVDSVPKVRRLAASVTCGASLRWRRESAGTHASTRA